MSLELSKKASAVKASSTLAIPARAKELRAQGKDVVGFGAGEPDFNTPDNICDAAVAAIREGFTKYTPASGTNELKQAVCKKFREFNHLEYSPEQIVISNGGKHSLKNIFTAIINPGDEVIIPAPYWLSYPEIVKLAGGVPVIVTTTRRQDYKLTGEELERAVTDKTKAVILNTPNNPTGMLYTEEELRAIADVAVRKDFYVVADEMYEHLVYGKQHHISIASLGKDIYDRTITCSGLAKSYSMTGWRIGYTGSSREIAKMMGSVQSHETSNPNSIAQRAAVEALNGPQDSVESMRREFDARRKYVMERIDRMPLVSAIEPMGAFYVFVDAGQVIGRKYGDMTVDSVAKMAEILINEYNTAVVPCGDFGFEKHLRLSYAISHDLICKGMDRIEDFLKKLQ